MADMFSKFGVITDNYRSFIGDVFVHAWTLRAHFITQCQQRVGNDVQPP